jgi:hypothetical protein
VFLTTSASAQFLAGWYFNGFTAEQSKTNTVYAQQYVLANFASQPVATRLSQYSHGFSNTWGAGSFNASTLSAAIATNSCIQISLNPAERLLVSNVSLLVSRLIPDPYFINLSLFAATDESNNFQQVGVPLSVTSTNPSSPDLLSFSLPTSFSNTSSPITFRAYFYGSGTNIIRLGDADNSATAAITIYGIPEPSTYALLLLAGVVAAVMVRRRAKCG